MGKTGPLEWSSRLPDLTLLDLFLWGHLKNNVFLSVYFTGQFKIANYTGICKTVTIQMLKSITSSTFERYEKCDGNDGGHFDNYLFNNV